MGHLIYGFLPVFKLASSIEGFLVDLSFAGKQSFIEETGSFETVAECSVRMHPIKHVSILVG